MPIIKSNISECVETTVVALSYDDIMLIIEELGITPPEEGVDVYINYEKSNGAKIILAPIFKDGDKINIEWKTASNTTTDTSYTITDITAS